jgi:hypothetical protein
MCEPPFDDELEPTVWASAHQLTLDWSAGQLPMATLDDPPAPQRPVVAGASAEAKDAVYRFVRSCVEVLNGYRPAAHMRRLAVPTEAAAIVAQLMATAHRVTEMRRRLQSPTKRTSQRALPVAVVRLRLCEPRPGAVEAAFALVLGDRTWAMALRMEQHHQAWSATTLRLV